MESNRTEMAKMQAALADFIRRLLRNTKILHDHPRLGPVAGSSPAGYQHNSDLEKNSTTSESRLNRRRIRDLDSGAEGRTHRGAPLRSRSISTFSTKLVTDR